MPAGFVRDQLPTRASVIAARRSGVLPDGPIGVLLIHGVESGRDFIGGGSIVEHGPTRAVASVAGLTGRLQEGTILMPLVQLLAGDDFGSGRVVVELLPTGAVGAGAGWTGIVPDSAVILQLVHVGK